MNIRDAILTGLIVITGGQMVQAEPVVKCNGTEYKWCRSIGDTNVFLNDPNDLSTIKDGFIYIPGGCDSIAIPENERKCNDSDLDGQVDEVISKTAQEIADEQVAQASALALAEKAAAEAELEAGGSSARFNRSLLLSTNTRLNAFATAINDLRKAHGIAAEIPQITKQQAISAVKAKINSKDTDKVR
ncbi:MAG: hypothetical protein DRJ03_03480 [Chloroflexi bacterium]|nr:MAG: hypothetical protein DRJ03_03480 [Chloroflexota bacterium]